MISKIADSLLRKDSSALASCFSDNCTYYDYCPSLKEMNNIYIFGRECLQLLMMKLFLSGSFSAAEIQIESENSLSFFGEYNGPFIFARLTIEEYDDNGLVKKAVVRPA